jgi:hypothetical protein
MGGLISLNFKLSRVGEATFNLRTTRSAIKETSFVYQGKRGFFLHFGQKSGKYRQNRAFKRLISRPEARFFRFQGGKSVYLLGALCTNKERPKGLTA